MKKSLLLLITSIFILFSINIKSEQSVIAEESKEENISFDDISSYYYDIPENYNMKSCEKVTKGGSDVINFNLKLYKCVNNRSSGNNNIACNKDWLIAYSEVASIEEFPLLNFFSSASPVGTISNPVFPPCYYDIRSNIIDSTDGADTLNFNSDYPGLLKLKSNSRNYTANIKFPKLGTAILCGVVDWRSNYSPLMLDIMAFQNLPAIQDTYMPQGSDDGIFSFFYQVMKHLNIFEQSLKSKESQNIRTVESSTMEVNSSKEFVCSDLKTPITKINISDSVSPSNDRKDIILNDTYEVENYTNSEVCDLQFKQGKVSGANCTMSDGSRFPENYDYRLVNLGFEMVYDCIIDEYGEEQCYCKETEPICGKVFSCYAKGPEAYDYCRSSGYEVSSIDGNPSIKLSSNGFDELSITGGNILLANTVNLVEQNNSALEVSYGENIGIKIDVKRKIYDLNSKNEKYDPLKIDSVDFNISDVNSRYKQYISYKKTDYNSYYNNSFQSVGSETVSQYYFPFLGKIPYIYERLSVINTNVHDKESANSLLKRNINYENNTNNNNYLGMVAEQILEMQKTQLPYCSDLNDDEKKIYDCYGKNDNDGLISYLKENGLTKLNRDCIALPGVNPTTIPSVTPPANGYTYGSIYSNVSPPIQNIANYTIATSDPDHPGTDYFTPTGTSLYAIADGEVVFVRDGLSYQCNFLLQDCSFYNSSEYTQHDQYNYWWGGYGNVVGIRHLDGITVYAHMNTNQIAVRVGQQVYKGEYIGKSGNIGTSTGPHLHFEMRKLNCVQYQTYCTINNNDNSMFLNIDGNFINNSTNTNTNTSTNNNSSSINNPNNLPYCTDSTVRSFNPIEYTDPDNTQYNGDCLFVAAANAINSSSSKISPEVIYAIAKKEVAMDCTKKWEDWASGVRTTCTGDPNQLAFITRNGTAWDGRIAQGYCPVDVRGFTQFSAKGNSLSCADTFNYIISRNYSDMQACVNALGLDNPVGEEIDPNSSYPQFSRHRVGDTICATGILMAEYGRIFNNGQYLTENDWKQLDSGSIGYNALYFAAGRYHGDCSLNYCTLTLQYARSAMNSNILSQSNCLK